jgi:hypothetical protein
MEAFRGQVGTTDKAKDSFQQSHDEAKGAG